LRLQAHAGGVAKAEEARDERVMHQLALAEQLAVRGPVAAGADDEPRRDLDAPPHLHRPARPLRLGADDDVGQDVIPRDDPAQRPPDDACLVEDVAQQLGVVPGLAHAASVYGIPTFSRLPRAGGGAWLPVWKTAR